MFEFTKEQLKKLTDIANIVAKAGVRHYSINLGICKVAFYFNPSTKSTK